MEEETEYDIAIVRVSGLAAVDETRITCAIEAALLHELVSAAVISVAIVDDADMAQLNKRHLDRDGSTDVLAFNMSDEADGDATRDTGVARCKMSGRHLPGSDPGQDRLDHAARAVIEGEIVISLDTASREADRRKHSLEAELALYAVHGTLHLLGYDDQDEEKAARMHAVEDEVLVSVGLGRVYGTRPK